MKDITRKSWCASLDYGEPPPPIGSPARDMAEEAALKKFKPAPRDTGQYAELTPVVRMEWFRKQIERDLAYFEALQTDWLGLEAKEVWKTSRNPEATRAKINASKKVLAEIVFRLRRLNSKKKPWNKGELKPKKE